MLVLESAGYDAGVCTGRGASAAGTAGADRAHLEAGLVGRKNGVLVVSLLLDLVVAARAQPPRNYVKADREEWYSGCMQASEGAEATRHSAHHARHARPIPALQRVSHWTQINTPEATP